MRHHPKYNDAIVKIRFHEYMSPLILFVRNNVEYTKYLLKNITQCDSIYSMRIYELLKQYQIIGERTIELTELREMLGIEKKEYKLYGDFKRYVLEHAQKEINTKTDITISYEEKKKARKVIAIKFYIKAKSKKSDTSSLDALPKEQLIRLLQLEIQNRYVVRINDVNIESHTQGAILKLLKDLKQGNYDKTNIRSPEGFFKWQLEELEISYQLNE